MTEHSTRDRIVHAAMTLFFEKGYGATSVADLLKTAGVNSGSLYHAFPGKQDVLLAVLDRYRHGIREMLLEPAWDGVADPLERVFALLGRYRELILQTDFTYGCPIGSIALELHEPDPAVRDLLSANFANWTGAIQECLEAAADRLPPDLDRAALADLVLCTMEGGIMLARTHRTIAPFDRAVAQLRMHVDLLTANAKERAS